MLSFSDFKMYLFEVVTERKLILNCYSTPIDRYLSLRVLDFSEFKQILNSYFIFKSETLF